ncbi:rod shape-determining protein MreC [Algoriphagus ratkowskyi]|uniref:Cell shape-determining protein MreC n=1 Tax=Algoriphagus ratkowskyi TaxID=57028 RepID=A0A2W7R3B5_9BACT|nr:rod shape-determining protein MreC [Algoriphagus ratkowskyi]PZX54651.1 rod shape-determining protein MreC [Algoriphagus ratkowskyi]TXD76962.1 rod shape-determining protein MreC [Algoriphagus ratkowskyi]
MLRILQFLYSLRSFLLFVLLEVLAIGLIVSNNSPQGAAFYNSSNALTGSVLKTRSDVMDFFSLAEANEALLSENAGLLEHLKERGYIPDSIALALDSALEVQYNFKGARIISNSLRFAQNHLTLNKGSKDGVKPGMGIFNEQGVIGRVKSVSENFSVGISLLNTGMTLSSKIKTNNSFGTTNWDGLDSKHAKLLYVPSHVIANVGDTIVTTGFSNVFPEGIEIGIISSVEKGENPNFLDIVISLSTDFSSAHYVYLVENTQANELDSLYKTSQIENEF